MSAEAAAESSSAEQLTPQEVRITSHGKMNVWVDFALKYFEENAERPLVLHTLPAPPSTSTTPAEPQDTTTPIPDAAVPAAKPKSEKMHPSLALIPRLVSVVEIIKREYVKMLDPALAEKGTVSGLHQYNELGELSVSTADAGEDEDDAEKERLENLATMLQGKKHLKIRKIAYMKITLCRKELRHPLAKSTTYQKPSVRKLSRSARSRVKKRLAKDAQGQAEGA